MRGSEERTVVDRARVRPGSRDALLGALLDEGAALLAASKAVG